MTTVPSIAFLIASLTLQAEPPAALPGESPTPQPARYSFYWGDVDGDALEDALAVDLDGRAVLLLNRGDGSFEDATLAAGLAELEGVTLAAFADFDGDGRADLFVGGLSGRGRLFRNGDGAIFERTDSGLDHAELDLAARAIDFDADGQLDLQIETQAGELLYRNLGRARFERVELPLAPTAAPGLTLGPSVGDDSAQQATAAALARARRILERARNQRSASSSTSAFAAGPGGNPSPWPGTPGGASSVLVCSPTIVDQSTANCLFASSTPSLGNLYPLSTAFNVDTSGRVGVNTIAPAHRVHIVESAGTALFAQGATTGVRGDANLVGSGNRIGGEFTASGGSNNIGVRGSSSIGVYGIGGSGGIGVLGETNGSSSTGVHGKANHATATTTGVLGEATSPDGTGVRGTHLALTGTAAGVYGRTNSSDYGAAGVRGETSTLTTTYGVHGISLGFTGTGVRGDGNFVGVSGFGPNNLTLPSDVAGVWGSGETGVVGVTSVGSQAGVFGVTEANALLFPSTGVLGRNRFDQEGWGVVGDNGTGPGFNGPAGVIGIDSRTNGAGVIGEHSASTGTTPGVEGLSDSSSSGAPGILGRTTHNTAVDTIGVRGESTPAPFFGIGGDFEGGWIGARGSATTPGTGSRYGGRFIASDGSTNNFGVYAIASGTGAIGVHSIASGTGALAGQFLGNVSVSGTLSKGGGSFKIDHPLDPQNKYLYHSFVESPDMMNVYNGNVVLDASGHAWVELPDWFEALNKDFRYQLTPIGAPAMVFVAEKVAGNRFGVGGRPGLEVSWQVTGIRKDAFANAKRIPVEEDKTLEERGLYLHADAHGMPRESSIDYVLHQRAMELKQAPLEAARAEERVRWAEQEVRAQEARARLERWNELGLPPPATAVSVPDADQYLKDHPDYPERTRRIQEERAKRSEKK